MANALQRLHCVIGTMRVELLALQEELNIFGVLRSCWGIVNNNYCEDREKVPLKTFKFQQKVH